MSASRLKICNGPSTRCAVAMHKACGSVQLSCLGWEDRRSCQLKVKGPDRGPSTHGREPASTRQLHLVPVKHHQPSVRPSVVHWCQRCAHNSDKACCLSHRSQRHFGYKLHGGPWQSVVVEDTIMLWPAQGQVVLVCILCPDSLGPKGFSHLSLLGPQQCIDWDARDP